MDEQVNPKDHKSKRNIITQNHSESKNEKVLPNYNNDLKFIFIQMEIENENIYEYDSLMKE